MKNSHKAKSSTCRIEVKPLTLGELVAATYGACGELRAPRILQLAMASNMVRSIRSA